jgi:hypothetical protein
LIRYSKTVPTMCSDGSQKELLPFTVGSCSLGDYRKDYIMAWFFLGIASFALS